MVKGALATFIMVPSTGHCFQDFGICKNDLVNSSVVFLMTQTFKNEISLSPLKKHEICSIGSVLNPKTIPPIALPKASQNAVTFIWRLKYHTAVNLSFSYIRA